MTTPKTTIQDDFTHYFVTGLGQLEKELESYPSETSLWITTKGILNSGGNLAYHLLGNLNHFIGAALGNTGYVRNRPEEFNIKNVPRSEISEWISETVAMVESVLPAVEDLDAPYPGGYFSKEGSIRYILLQFVTHLQYHLGQINYHRRILFPEG